MLCLCTEHRQLHYRIGSISSIADSITGRNPFLPSGGEWCNIKMSVKWPREVNVTALQRSLHNQQFAARGRKKRSVWLSVVLHNRPGNVVLSGLGPNAESDAIGLKRY
jgi:hypothetical protein